MRALFVYCYCTMGGVETGMRFRLSGLDRHGVSAQGVFLRDYGGKAALRGLEDRVHVGVDEPRFAEILQRGSFDVVSIIDSFEVFDWLERAGFQGRVVVELRSSYRHTLEKIAGMAGRRVDAILVPSRFQAENIQGFLPKGFIGTVPVFVVPNFVDLEVFSPAKLDTPGLNSPVVCWVGRIDPLKNWSEFLEISRRLAAKPDLEFWMVGGGRSDPKNRDEFRKALADRLAVAARLRWWPIVNNRSMPRLFSLVAGSGGCVVLTSICESFGFAALEAQACGCPVVASRAGGVVEVVRDGASGFLYSLGKIDEAVAMILKIVEDPVLRGQMSDAGPRLMREMFDRDQCLREFAAALRGDAPNGRGGEA